MATAMAALAAETWLIAERRDKRKDNGFSKRLLTTASPFLRSGTDAGQFPVACTDLAPGSTGAHREDYRVRGEV
jgi:hypothetical protein